MDYNGKKVKSFYTADDTIKHFCVVDNIAWIFSGGTIYRIYLPTGDIDTIFEGINTNEFCQFFSPISNYEVQWGERVGDNSAADSRYYNAKTKEYKTKDYKDTHSEVDERGFCNNTGWWFVPEDSYDRLDKLTFTLPKHSYRNPIATVDVLLCCGGALELQNVKGKLSLMTINYDFKGVFDGETLIGVEGIPSWYKLGDFKPYDGNNKIVITDGEFAPHYNDFDDYRFAFICEGEGEPVYALIFLSSNITQEDFLNMVESVKIEK